MKKNVKILGAAAAALLAVAPVAAGVVPAANSVALADSGSSEPGDYNQGVVEVSYYNENGFPTASIGQSLANWVDGNHYGISLTNGATFENRGRIDILDQNNHVIDNVNNIKFDRNSKFKQQFTTGLSLASANAGQLVFVKDSIGIHPAFVNATGTLTSADDYGTTQPSWWNNDPSPVAYKATYKGHYYVGSGVAASYTYRRQIGVTDPTKIGTPYFVLKNSEDPSATFKNGNIYLKGDNVWATDIPSILSTEQAHVKAVYTDSGLHDAKDITTPETIRQDLADQGISVSGDSINSSVNSFYITLHAIAPGSNKTGTTRLYFNRDTNWHLYPMIYYKGLEVIEGDHTAGLHTPNPADFIASAGSDKARALASKPQANFSAQNIYDRNSGSADISVMANNINPDVPGVYPVTIQATNPNGYTTKYTFNVYITNPNGTAATIHYVPGYGVNVWRRVGTNAVAFDGHTRLLTGTNVTTHETATINGISYTRVTAEGVSDPENVWVQTEYLSDAWKPATPSHSNNGEEAMTGIAHVTYNGRGGVRLLNADGKYQNQYVKKGSNWKVFAKKQINGRTMYKLGTENQWIPAEYVSVR